MCYCSSDYLIWHYAYMYIRTNTLVDWSYNCISPVLSKHRVLKYMTK